MSTKATVMAVGAGQTLKKSVTSIPTPQQGQLLVKVASAAFNPTDAKSFDMGAFPIDGVPGCDFAGSVESVGEGVTTFKEGDTIASFRWGGMTPGLGAYSTFTITDARFAYKVPKESVSLDAAASVPLATATAWLALLSPYCLSIPRSYKGNVLVWGGSSSVGMFALQLAKILGWGTIATASSKNAELARSFGADHVVDYKEPDVVSKIREIDPSIKYAFDTIGEKVSSEPIGQILTGNDGSMCTVRPGKGGAENVPKDVKVSDVLVWTMYGEPITYRSLIKYSARPEDSKLTEELFNSLAGWMQQQKFKPNPITVLSGGVDAVPELFQRFRDGKNAATKVVIHPQETST